MAQAGPLAVAASSRARDGAPAAHDALGADRGLPWSGGSRAGRRLGVDGVALRLLMRCAGRGLQAIAPQDGRGGGAQRGWGGRLQTRPGLSPRRAADPQETRRRHPL